MAAIGVGGEPVSFKKVVRSRRSYKVNFDIQVLT